MRGKKSGQGRKRIEYDNRSTLFSEKATQYDKEVKKIFRKRREENQNMKECLENYDVLYFLAAVTCVSLLLKCISFFLYKRLLRDSNQMGTTDNKWMKSMMAKFEAYYKLRISVHNVENFVDRYLYRYHFWGLSLQGWEYIGYYAAVVTLAATALFYLAAGYYQLTVEWFLIMGFCVVSLLLIQGVAAVLFNTHRSRKIFRIQLIDYMENTMRARLENEYFHQEATKQYQMEYFETGELMDKDERVQTEKSAVSQDKAVSQKQTVYREQPVSYDKVAATRDRSVERLPENTTRQTPGIRELLESLLEELQLDKEIARKQQSMNDYAAAERAQLFEEILKEYM